MGKEKGEREMLDIGLAAAVVRVLLEEILAMELHHLLEQEEQVFHQQLLE